MQSELAMQGGQWCDQGQEIQLTTTDGLQQRRSLAARYGDLNVRVSSKQHQACACEPCCRGARGGVYLCTMGIQTTLEGVLKEKNVCFRKTGVQRASLSQCCCPVRFSIATAAGFSALAVGRLKLAGLQLRRIVNCDKTAWNLTTVKVFWQ